MPTKTAWTCWRNPVHDPIDTTTFGWPRCAECGAAPAYHERPAYLPDGFALNLYVPLGALRGLTIKPGSGIVGVDLGERVSIYYEGFVQSKYQYEDLTGRPLWEKGVMIAADRQITGYPTIAQASPRPQDVQCIGTYDPRTNAFDVTDEKALDEWLADA